MRIGTVWRGLRSIGRPFQLVGPTTEKEWVRCYMSQCDMEAKSEETKNDKLWRGKVDV